MVKRHLKRFASPTTWQIKKKGIKFITRPNPGTHPLELSMPICVVLKEMIKAARTTAEVKKLLYSNEVLVDGKRVKDYRFPVGLMDVVSLVPSKQNFRIVLGEKGKLGAIEIDAKESKMKLSRIKNKTAVKGKKIQVNLADSRNIIVEKDSYKTGDCLMVELPSQKILGHFKLEKGAAVQLLSGKHIAEIGNVVDIKGKDLIYKNANGEELTTLKKYAFVVGKQKPEIKIK